MNKTKTNFSIKICMLLVILIFCMQSVSAHDLDIEIVERSITVKAIYSDGKPAANAEIIIYNSNREIYLSGTTNEHGEYSFEIGDELSADEFFVEVQQTGHRSSITIDLRTISRGPDDMFIGFKIIAGLGYLVGIAGIISYYLFWKMKKNDAF